MTVIRQVPEVRPEPRVCADCGQPIMPGQLYLVGEPLHVYCGASQRHPWDWYTPPSAGVWPA